MEKEKPFELKHGYLIAKFKLQAIEPVPMGQFYAFFLELTGPDEMAGTLSKHLRGEYSPTYVQLLHEQSFMWQKGIFETSFIKLYEFFLKQRFAHHSFASGEFLGIARGTFGLELRRESLSQHELDLFYNFKMKVSIPEEGKNIERNTFRFMRGEALYPLDREEIDVLNRYEIKVFEPLE